MGRMILPEPGGQASDDVVRAERVRTLLLARCRRFDGSAPRLRVRNLSARGLCGVHGNVIDFAVGEPVHIVFDRVAPVAATVTWVDDLLVGVTFRNAIDLDQLAALRAG